MARREGVTVPLSRFGVLVAQLESIAASARQQPPDPLLCFDLLSELVAAIDDEPREAVVQWQRKCEDALYSLLILGARRPIRRLASLAMAKVIAKGDAISIYSRASSLRGWLADSKRGEPSSFAGAAQCLGELYTFFGRKITSGLTETASIAAKLMKYNEDFLRQDALQMLCNALEGSDGAGAAAAYSEAFRIIMRIGMTDKSSIVRLASAKCLKTFANIGGPGLGITELENAASFCIKALEDSVPSVRDAFAEALGVLLALGMNPEAQRKQRERSTDPAKRVEGGLQKHLVSPFIKASGSRAKELRIGLALSWVYFLQAACIKHGLPDSELQNFALQAMDMLQGNPFVEAHSLACVLYIIRVGVVDQMMEPTQRNFLVLLAKQLESSSFSPSKGIATLRTLSYLLAVLGEVPAEFKELLDNTVVAALSHSSINLRIEATLTLRGLAEVDPTCVGGLISYGVATLQALRESVSFEKGDKFKFELDSFHGQATVLAALVSISPKLLLGYPARLPSSVFAFAKQMLTEFSRNPAVASVEKESGWLLLASLIASMPKEELEDQVFDVLVLWTDSLGAHAGRQMQKAEDLISDISVLSAAVEALTAFIRSFVSSTVTTTNMAILLQPVLFYLTEALSYISILISKQLENIKPALDLFTIRTLVAYQSLSDPMVYKGDHARIIQICTSPFREPSGCEESSCLRLLLDKKDACLGPWTPGRDWFEDELRAFEGGKDGILPCVWENQISTFPLPDTISKTLINQMLLCFGCLFSVQDKSGKLVLLNMIDQCLKSGRKQSWHAASLTNACVGLLAGLKALIAIRPQNLDVEILGSMQATFQSILAEGEICASQRRAAAEGLGLLARLGSDSFTARMARSLLGELVVATDPYYIGSLALSLGCIHRSAGGMALSTLVPSTVSSISLLAKSSNAVLQQWLLHALLLTIEAAGLSYVSQVQATLFLAVEILLSEESGRIDLRQGVGRLINAIVAILGPELSPGSTFFSRCKSVVAETSSGQETSTLVECVRFTQQLVLFAPQAVSVHSHVQTLLPTLSSKQPTLRHLAISTLKHLIETEPAAIINERVEENLFSMLDDETDSEIGNLIRTTISRLFNVSCPSYPSRWIIICRNMILATSSRTSTAESHASWGNVHSNGTSKTDAKLYFGDDDDNMIASSDEKVPGSTYLSSSHLKKDRHLRYRTRLFAAECLSYLPTTVGTDPAHFDLSLARKQKNNGHPDSGSWLVLHLQELVSLAYQISTSQFQGMQPIGLNLLISIMDKFERISDPELPGHFLLEQYQAQLVSAVRSSITLSSSPLLLEAGLQLAAKVLTSSVMNGDRVALQRMFSLILLPLEDFKNLYYPSFAEWVACKIKIRLLAAHASIKVHVYSMLRQSNNLPEEFHQLLPSFSKCSNLLGNYWISVLQDYSYICLGLQSKSGYKPFLDGIQSLLVSSKVRACIDEAWPPILQATVLDALPEMLEMKKNSQNNTEDLSSLFISGYSMVKLSLKEFQFLWGFTMLVLFQGQRQSGSKIMVKEMQGMTSFETSLLVFNDLSSKTFYDMEYIPLDVCQELLQVLIYADQMSDAWDHFAIPLLSKIIQFCPKTYFEMEDFIYAATELCMTYLYRLSQSNHSFLDQDQYCEKDIFSPLFSAAEQLAFHIHNKKLWRLMMALLSASYECVDRISSDSLWTRLVVFLRNISPLLTTCFGDNAELGNYDASMLLGAWATVITNLSHNFIKRIHILHQESDPSKLLTKKLAFCLEEAVSILRVAYKSQLDHTDSDRMLFCSLCKLCINCIHMTLNDTSKQVLAVGVSMLKNITQKKCSEGSNIPFLIFFIGELLGDIFLLIQKILREKLSWETVSVLEDCLTLLFLLHTLPQESKCLQPSVSMLLEAILMVCSAFDEAPSKELHQIKNVAMILISRLVQIPSSAIQIKDILLSMPVMRRQQLQDIIRASATQSQTQLHIKPINPLIIKLPVKLEPTSREVSPPSMVLFHEDSVKKGDDAGGIEGVDDEDDDWDTFQSFPASNAATDLQTETNASEFSSTVIYPAPGNDHDSYNNVDQLATTTSAKYEEEVVADIADAAEEDEPVLHDEGTDQLPASTSAKFEEEVDAQIADAAAEDAPVLLDDGNESAELLELQSNDNEKASGSCNDKNRLDGDSQYVCHPMEQTCEWNVVNESITSKNHNDGRDDTKKSNNKPVEDSEAIEKDGIEAFKRDTLVIAKVDTEVIEKDGN